MIAGPGRVVLGSAIAILAVLAGLLLFRAGESGDSLEALLAGEPRRPDVVGTIAHVDATGVTLTDGSRFTFWNQSVIVSSYTGEPVTPRPNQFVHMGVVGEHVRWMAVLGVVAKVTPRSVAYTGFIATVVDNELIFEDGTVLPTNGSVTAFPGFAIVELDPVDGRVRRVQQDLLPGGGRASDE